MIVATDLEGVLIPEIWVEVAERLALEDLRITTREEPDFEKLMKRRIEILQRAKVGLPDIQRIAHNVLPFPGATEILAWLARRGQLLIISDTFHELSDPVVERLGRYNLFANRFRVGEGGRIEGVQLRIRGMKVSITRAFRELGFTITAIGDSSNDHTMLEDATVPILFNPTADLRRSLPQAPAVTNYVELKNLIEKIEDEGP